MIYVGLQPGSDRVATVVVAPQPGDFAPGLAYHLLPDGWPALPQVGWVRDPTTGRVAPPPAPVPEG